MVTVSRTGRHPGENVDIKMTDGREVVPSDETHSLFFFTLLSTPGVTGRHLGVEFTRCKTTVEEVLTLVFLQRLWSGFTISSFLSFSLSLPWSCGFFGFLPITLLFLIPFPSDLTTFTVLPLPGPDTKSHHGGRSMVCTVFRPRMIYHLLT